MNAKKSKSIFKLFALVLAFAFTVLFIPVGELVAWARIADEYVDYSYIKIGEDGKEVKNTIYTGETYYIPKAYIGGDTRFVIGDGQTNTLIVDEQEDSDDVTLVSSKITVTYGSSNSEGSAENGLVIDVTPVADGNSSGSFVASRLGTYTVTYAYTYRVGTAESGTEYTNYYDMKVVSSISEATIELDNNSEYLFPSVIDAKVLKEKNGGTFPAEIKLPIPTVYDEDGEEVKNIILTTDSDVPNSSEETRKNDYLVVTMIGGAKTADLTEHLSIEGGEIVLSGEAFTANEGHYSSYTLKYAYYHNGQFVLSTTKTATVYNEYYQNYSASNLTLELDSSLTTSAQPGIAQTLPGVTVTTNNNVSPANEEVEVSYKVKVRYRANGDPSYSDLDPTLYNAGEEDVIDSNGYLIDPTTFTPLQAGNYTFNYVACDFYGNEIPNGGTPDGRYEWTNIQDTTAPTAIVYDASEKDSQGNLTYEDASDKLARRANYNGVVVYAVGLEDNLTTVENATLRRVVYANSEELFTIEDYDNKNLIFNYRASSDEGAYQQLMNNNYLIRKAVDKYNADEATLEEDKVVDDATMLKWLKSNGYLIVIDNGGTNGNQTNTYARSIYNMFIDSETDESIFNAVEGIENEETFLRYVKDSANKDALEELGFAYINTDRTFGAQTSNGGFSYSSYQIRYIAQDEAGNSNYISRDITLTTTIDSTAPEITFSTNFSDTYREDAEVEFAVPTASDNGNDTRMKVQTYYRFLNGTTPILEIKDDDKTISVLDNTEVFDDLRNQRNTNENNEYYYDVYKSYEGEGYISLTDPDATNYIIDLALGSKQNATKVQVFSYVYDDYGNVGVMAREFNISNTVDTRTPQFRQVTIDDNAPTSYLQGDDISLPSVTVVDDNVNFMNFNVSIYHEREDGSRVSVTNPTDAGQNRDNSQFLYTVNGGTFNAAFEGNYVASIELKDYNNARIVVFTRYTVGPRLIIQDPEFNVSFENQTVELDDSPVIDLPTPTISYSIDNSLDYESYKEETYTVKPEVVLIGVDENGYATDYETNRGMNSFSPTEKGEYAISYTTRLRVYSTSQFEYHEMTVEDAYAGRMGDYFSETDETYAQDNYLIRTENETTYRVFVADPVIEEQKQTYTEYLVTENAEGAVQVTKVSGTGADPITIDQARFENWQNNLKMYVWESDNLSVTVNDTKGPKLKNYDYIEAISSDALDKTNDDQTRGYALNIQGIEATDASGINYSRSSVTITTTYKVDGSTRTSVDTLTNAEKIEGTTINVTQNGTVTIAYTVYDNNGNSTKAEYVIRAGDNTNPIIRVNTVDETDFIGTTYSLSDFQEYEDGRLFTVDLTQLTFTDDKTADADLTVTYEFVNDDTSDEPIEAEVENENQVAYKITEVGNYTFTVTVTDEAGNAATREFSFEVTEETYDPTITYRVIGTVLIVISVLLLAGVIIYFIVSKVKLDKELKK